MPRYGDAVGTVREAAARLLAAAENGELERVCRSHGVDLLVLFGSAARAEGEPADLDVAYRFARDHAGGVLALLDDLASLAGTSKIDLLDLGRAGPVARERALVGVVPLYQATSGLYAKAQMAATGERMDTAWLRRLDLGLMAG